MHAVIVLWRISQLILVKTGRAVQELYYEQTVVEKVDKIKLMLLCVQAVTVKGHTKSKRGKNSFQVISSVTHTKIKA